MAVYRMPDGTKVRFPDDMPREEIAALIEEKYPQEVASANLSALSNKLKGGPGVGSETEARYNAALDRVRQTQYAGMSDQQWREYSAKFLAPYNKQDLANESLTLGLQDEIASGIGAFGSQVKSWLGDDNSPGYGDAYNALVELEQARRDLGREKEGVLGTAAEVVGGLATMRAPLTAATSAPSVLRTAIEGGTTGAALGGIYGAGAADEDRLSEGVKGAAVGGALGTALPVLAAGVSQGLNSLSRLRTGRTAANRLGVSPGSARFLQETLAADDALSPAGIGRIAAAGQEGMLADAGPSARNALDFAIQSSGRAGRLATDEISARVGRDSQAVTRALDNALGTPQGVETTRTAIRVGSAPARSNAYEAAYARPVGYDTEAGMLIQDLLQRVPPEALRRAQRLMATRGEESAEAFLEIADDGTVTMSRLPDVREIDYIIRALNDEAKSGIGMGAMGGQTAVGASLEELANNLRLVLRNQVPEYDRALGVAADPIRRSQAVEHGADLLKPSTTREQVAEWVDGITQPEREALLQGVRSSLDDAIANVTRAVADGDMDAREAIAALKRLSSRAAREKLRLAIDDDQIVNDLFDEMDRITQSFELRASVANNSRTFQRQEMNRRVDTLVDPDTALGALGRGEPVNAGKRLVRSFTGMSPTNMLRRKDETMVEVVNALTRRGPEAQRTLSDIRDFNAVTQTGNQRTVTLRQLLSGAASNVGNLATQRALSYQQ